MHRSLTIACIFWIPTQYILPGSGRNGQIQDACLIHTEGLSKLPGNWFSNPIYRKIMKNRIWAIKIRGVIQLLSLPIMHKNTAKTFYEKNCLTYNNFTWFLRFYKDLLFQANLYSRICSESYLCDAAGFSFMSNYMQFTFHKVSALFPSSLLYFFRGLY